MRGHVQVERAVRKTVQEALDAERAHSRRLQARVQAAEAAARLAVSAAPRLTEAEEAAIRGAHENVVVRERANAVAAVREMKQLSERAVRDGAAVLEARLQAERAACEKRILEVQVCCG
jgi:uncharacterized protein YPO0396